MSEEPETFSAPIGFFARPEQRPRKRARFFGAAGVSLAAHIGVLIAVLSMGPAAPPPVPPAPVTVSLLSFPRIAPDTPPPAPANPAPPKPPPPRELFRETKAPDPPKPLAVTKTKVTADPMPGLTDAELAGAATAGSGAGAGGGGAPCDMAARVQAALRRDPLVQAQIAPLGGKALMIWDGDWVWLPGEDGRGLTAVRQAVMWEIGFSPSECRAQMMHGLVVLTPTESHGALRLAFGRGVWRWSDLLQPHPGTDPTPSDEQ